MNIDLQQDPIPLHETIRRDGTVAVKLIQPGWGSSGYYSSEVLERDGPEIFKEGTKMFWDHPTADQEQKRPEGSLNDLAAVLVTGARYNENGAAGPGLYADAKPFGGYKESLKELAPHIGISIRGKGTASMGQAEGRKGRIVESITDAKSADFVTVAGAGGEIVSLFESARTFDFKIEDNKDMELDLQLKEAVKLNEDLTAQNEKLTAALSRLQERALLGEAKSIIATNLSESKLHKLTATRLSNTLLSDLPVVDGTLDTDAFETTVKEAITEELDYIKEVAGAVSGKITGMGSSDTTTSNFKESENTEDAERRLLKAMSSLGLSESAATDAANGRGY